jgi:hypothetical protein
MVDICIFILDLTMCADKSLEYHIIQYVFYACHVHKASWKSVYTPQEALENPNIATMRIQKTCL